MPFDPSMLAQALAARQGGGDPGMGGPPPGMGAPPAPSPVAQVVDQGVGLSPLMKLVELLSAVAGIGGTDPMQSAPPPSF